MTSWDTLILNKHLRNALLFSHISITEQLAHIATHQCNGDRYYCTSSDHVRVFIVNNCLE